MDSPLPHEKRLRKNLKRKRTYSEIMFKRILDELEIRYKFQKFIRCDRARFVDFYLPEYKLIIEIDGYYHNMPDQITRDKQRETAILDKLPQWKIKRITDEQLINDKDSIINELEALKKERIKYLYNLTSKYDPEN